MKYPVYSAFIAFLFLLVSCSEEEPNCLYKSLSLIQTIRGCADDDCTYTHEVLSEDLYTDCLDSLSVMKLVNEYVAKNSIDTPISSIEIYNSKKDFDIGETLSQPAEYYQHRIMQIDFESKYHKGIIFTFYKWGYKGKEWYPNKKR